MLRRLSFPVLFFGGLAALVLGVEAGLPRIPLAGAVLVLFGASVAALERLIPYHESWNADDGELGLDAGYSLSNGALQPLVTGLTTALFARVGGELGGPFWPGGWPLPAQLALAVLVRQFFQYWLHRLTHERGGFLWRMHAIHHGPRRLWWLNSMRLHAGNFLVDSLVGLGPLVALGAGEDALLLTGMTVVLHDMLAHSNADFRLGPLNWVLGTNELHRWHHSRVAAESRTNYGDVLIVWDLVFGTRALPARSLPASGVGIEGGAALPRSLREQFVAPFTAARS